MSNHMNTVDEALAGRVALIRQPTKYGSKVVRYSEGCNEWQFEHGKDGVWRLASRSTYGNTSFINGRGCDASGYRVWDPDQIAQLEADFNRKVEESSR